jgi:adenylate cyclase
MERRLTTILSADVVGYTRLMGEDEAGTLTVLKACRKELLNPKALQYHGRTIKLMGDGALMEFVSVVEAVSFAVEVQCAMRKRNAEVPEGRQIEFRIGVNVGDIVVDGDDIYGDGVNIAARLEGLAEPGGICVRRNVHSQVHDKLDLTFEDLGEVEMKNIAQPIRVYRIVLDDKAEKLVTPVAMLVRRERGPRVVVAATLVAVLGIGGLAWWQPWAPEFEPASVEAMAYPLPGKPSIAVLPFDEMGAKSDNAFLGEALAETILTDLSRFSEIFVISRNSSFAYKGTPVKVQKVAEELGVRYLVEGSVQRSNDRLRVNVQLIDAIKGHHLWAERYDREADELFKIQDEITRTVVAIVQRKVIETERTLAARKDPASLEAYEHVSLGWRFWMEWNRDSHARAKQQFEEALKLDPELASAYMGLAEVYVAGHRYGWQNISRNASLDRARELAEKALELAPFDYKAHMIMGAVHYEAGENTKALLQAERALQLNPNSADVMILEASVLVYVGQFDKAIERFQQAMRLNPHFPAWWWWNLSWAQYHAGKYQEALNSLERMSPLPNGARRQLAKILVRLGKIDEAKAVIAEFLRNEPNFTLEDERKMYEDHLPNSPHLTKEFDDLRAAGVPDEQ